YGVSARTCKSGSGQCRVADKWVGLAFIAEGRHRSMTRHERRLVAHRPEPFGDRADEVLLIPVREVPTPDRAAEQYVSYQGELRSLVMKDHVSRRMTGAVPHVED